MTFISSFSSIFNPLLAWHMNIRSSTLMHWAVSQVLNSAWTNVSFLSFSRGWGKTRSVRAFVFAVSVFLRQVEQYINIVKHLITNIVYQYHCNTFVAPSHTASTNTFKLNHTNPIQMPMLHGYSQPWPWVSCCALARYFLNHDLLMNWHAMHLYIHVIPCIRHLHRPVTLHP